MEAVVVKGGKFTFTFTTKDLSRGLRPSEKAARNTDFMIELVGAVSHDGVLGAMEAISRIDTTGITCAFPYPQLFILTNLILFCTSNKIYEVDDYGALTLVYTAAATSSPWSVVDYFDYIYLTNGIISVIRNPSSKVYELSTLPFASAACDFNGQLIIGAPNVGVYGTVITTEDSIPITTEGGLYLYTES